MVKILNQAVRRNIGRFPDDFMFQLSAEEHEILRSQIVTLRFAHGKHRKYRPLAFTEQGVAMLSSVLSSESAIYVNIEIMRAFVSLKKTFEEHKDLAKRMDALEQKYDARFQSVFDAIRQLMLPPSLSPSRRKIGF